MLRVVRDLLRSAALSLANRFFHSGRALVCVHHHLAIHVSSRSPDHLDERRLASQETFLVRIKNCHEGDFGQVEAFSQQIDTDEDIKFTKAKVAQNLYALNSVDIGVQVTNF